MDRYKRKEKHYFKQSGWRKGIKKGRLNGWHNGNDERNVLKWWWKHEKNDCGKLVENIGRKK